MTISKGRAKIVLCVFLLVALSAAVSAGLSVVEHNTETHPCDFYLPNFFGRCTVPYKFIDNTDEVDARYEVTIKAKGGEQTYWFTDDAQGIKLKLNNEPGFAIDTATYIPQRWREQQGQCADMSVSNTQLHYAEFDNYVEINRTSTVQGTNPGTMTEIWRIGFDGENYIRKSTVLLTSNAAGWENERHALKLELTGVDSITEDRNDIRDENGRPLKWRTYADDSNTILAFFDFANETRLEERIANGKATVHFFDRCDARGNFRVDPQLSMETSTRYVNISSNSTPSWTISYDMDFGGTMRILTVNGEEISVNGGSFNLIGLDASSGAISAGLGTASFYQQLDASAG